MYARASAVSRSERFLEMSTRVPSYKHSFRCRLRLREKNSLTASKREATRKIARPLKSWRRENGCASLSSHQSLLPSAQTVQLGACLIEDSLFKIHTYLFIPSTALAAFSPLESVASRKKSSPSSTTPPLAIWCKLAAILSVSENGKKSLRGVTQTA